MRMQYPIISVEQTGLKIKEACKEAGICARDIREYMNFASTQSVYDWFRGKNLPSLDNFYALARLLGVPMESLIVDADSPTGGTRRPTCCECTITKARSDERVLSFYVEALEKTA